jgi:hypothetical protein
MGAIHLRHSDNVRRSSALLQTVPTAAYRTDPTTIRRLVPGKTSKTASGERTVSLFAASLS